MKTMINAAIFSFLSLNAFAADKKSITFFQKMSIA